MTKNYYTLLLLLLLLLQQLQLLILQLQLLTRGVATGGGGYIGIYTPKISPSKLFI